MNGSDQPPQDWTVIPVSEHVRQIELLISNLLRVGVLASVLLIGTGTLVRYAQHPQLLRSPDALAELIQPRGARPHSLAEIAMGLSQFRGSSIVAAGLVVLIATPILRVAVSVVAFLREGDRLYTAITLAVFCLLLLSLALGRIE